MHGAFSHFLHSSWVPPFSKSARTGAVGCYAAFSAVTLWAVGVDVKGANLGCSFEQMLYGLLHLVELLALIALGILSRTWAAQRSSKNGKSVPRTAVIWLDCGLRAACRFPHNRHVVNKGLARTYFAVFLEVVRQGLPKWDRVCGRGNALTAVFR
jgi:hypothetical protein